MRKSALILSLTYSYLILGYPVVAYSQPLAQTDLACPADNSDQTVSSWRDTAIQKLLSGNTGVVRDKMSTCFPGSAPKCLEDLDYYLKHPPSRYGDGGDSGNTNLQDLTLKSEKDLPPEFLVRDAQGVPKPGLFKFPPDILNLAKQKGWKAINYKTRSTGGFDRAPNLTLVAIPGVDKDIYLQISPPPDPNRVLTDNDPRPLGDPAHGQSRVTVITVDKTKSPPVGQLRLLDYDSVGQGYQWQNHTKSQSCISCHTTPLRSISPRGYHATNGAEKRMNPQDEQTVQEINNMMVLEGLSWGKMTSYDGSGEVRRGPAANSQPYGWSPPNSITRKQDFVKGCIDQAESVEYRGFGDYSATFNPTPGPKHADWQKVSESMNCVQCHNGTVKGFLHSNFSPGEIQFKILVDRSMPPGFNLTQDERLALVSCLFKEKETVADKWQSSAEWLRRQGCESGSSQFRIIHHAHPAANPAATGSVH